MNQITLDQGIEDLASALCALERLAGPGGMARVFVAMPDPDRFALFGPPEEWMRAVDKFGRTMQLPLRHVRLPRLLVTLIGPPSQGLAGEPALDGSALTALAS